MCLIQKFQAFRRAANKSDWTGDMGRHDFDGLGDELPEAISRLYGVQDARDFDSSGMGPGNDIDVEEGEQNAFALDLENDDESSTSLYLPRPPA